MTVEYEIKQLIKEYADQIFQSWIGKVNKRLLILEDRLNDVDAFNAKDREEWVKIKEEINTLIKTRGLTKCVDVSEYYEEEKDESS